MHKSDPHLTIADTPHRPPTKFLIKTKRLRLVVGEAPASSVSYYTTVSEQAEHLP